MRDYQIAAVLEGPGEFEILFDFEAETNDDANAYAEANYPGVEWYVLRDGKNING